MKKIVLFTMLLLLRTTTIEAAETIDRGADVTAVVLNFTFKTESGATACDAMVTVFRAYLNVLFHNRSPGIVRGGEKEASILAKLRELIKGIRPDLHGFPFNIIAYQ
jgi:hypothetical protein